VLEEVMLTEFPTADAGQQLADLYGAASAGLPIAVTDDKDRLVGVVEPEAVFAQLSGDGDEATGDTPPTETDTANKKESAHV
jgi:glycine betaine/proline transport system ATP-binding protein